MDGFTDPVEDLALTHYVWAGRHLPGISSETARRVNDCAQQYRFGMTVSGKRSLLRLREGEWVEVPPIPERHDLVMTAHADLAHKAG